jgi:hypothetical protein
MGQTLVFGLPRGTSSYPPEHIPRKDTIVVKNTRGVLGGSRKGVVEGMATGFGGVVEDVAGVGMDGGARAGGEGEEEVLDGGGGAVGGASHGNCWHGGHTTAGGGAGAWQT